MPFTSIPFAYCFVLVLTLTWALRRWHGVQKWVLLAASYLLYAGWDVRLLGLLITSSIVNWALGEAIARSDDARSRRRWLWAGVAANLSFLGLFKYYDFFRQTFTGVAGWLGFSAHLPMLELVLPLGISFYTFQALAYLFDLERGTGIRARNPLDFLLFQALFPQLVAGPICRSRQLLPQIIEPSARKSPDVTRAIGLVASGLFKKAVIASFLATRIVEDAFVAPENHSSVELLLGLYAYTIQVYCDFSGYTDLVRGLGLMLGFELPENFRAPYAATSVGEFWRRWHMTFSSWLRDYLYFPLGGSKRGALRTYRNLMLTFLACGLWHGASWGFVLWGGIHGVALCLHKALRDFRRARGADLSQPPSPAWAIAGWFTTFHLCVFARVFFHAPDVETAWSYLVSMLRFTARGEGLDLWVVSVALLGLSLHFIGAHLRSAFEAVHARIPWPARPAVWGALGVLLLTLTPDAVAPFIYFKF